MCALPTEDLSLRWKDFESNLARSFSEMRHNSDFFDVKIACFDNESVMKTIPAHKVVLSACSPVFKELLHAIGTGDSKNPLLFLRGISYQEISAVLDFMYIGEAKVQEIKFDAFLGAAEELKIRGLTRGKEGDTSESTPSRKIKQYINTYENRTETKKTVPSSPIVEQQLEDKFEKNSTSSRKRKQYENTYENNDGLKAKLKKNIPSSPIVQQQIEDNFKNNAGSKPRIKKTRLFSPNVQASTSSKAVPEDTVERMVLKEEKVNFDAKYDDYQDFAESKMDDIFDDNIHEDHESETDNFDTQAEMDDFADFLNKRAPKDKDLGEDASTENEIDDSVNESTQDQDKAESLNVPTYSKGIFTSL